MAPRSQLQSSFNGGELSARMEGRPDLAAYGIAGRAMPNMLLTVQGPAVKRSGTRFTAFGKDDNQPVELLPFEFNVTQGYIIEAAPLAFRFFTNDVQIESAPGVPYQITTPYTADDLPKLDWVQSRDVLYLVDGRNQHRKLSRTSATTFALAALELKGGPFKDQNTNEALTVQASAGTGAGVTLTASAALFLPGHVGSLIEIEAKDFRTVPAWEPGVDMTVSAKRRSDGKVYQAIALPASGSTRTGGDRPIHTEGRELDGSSVGQDINSKDAGGVLWEYLYSRAGIARITAVASATSATITVIKRLPDEVVSGPTDLWALGAFSDAEGWPETAALRDERLWLFKNNEYYGSVAGDLEDFSARDESGLPQPDLSIRGRLPDPDKILWAVNDRNLLIGTDKREYALQPVNPAQAIAFNNLAAPRQSGHGSSKVRPVQAGSATLFVTRGGGKVRATDYLFDRDRYVAPDATVRSEHITKSGLCRMAPQLEPESLVWAVRKDGALICLTWDESQEVRGWTRHVLGGPGAKVRSIASIPSPDGTHDQLWMAVDRTLGSRTRRTIERLEPMWKEGQDQATGFFVDCGLSYEGAPATVISGLQHLAGETVTVIADGATHPDLVVSAGGVITLNRPASIVHVGFLFLASVEPMRMVPETPSGASLSKLKRVVKLGLGLQESMGLRVRRPGGRNDDVEFRTSSMAMNVAVPLFSGEALVGFPGGYDREARVVVESYQAMPFTLTSLAARVVVGDDE